MCCLNRIRLYKKNKRWLISILNIAARQYERQAERFLLFPEDNISVTIEHKRTTYKIPIKIITLWMQNLPRHETLAYAYDNILAL